MPKTADYIKEKLHNNILLCLLNTIFLQLI